MAALANGGAHAARVVRRVVDAATGEVLEAATPRGGPGAVRRHRRDAARWLGASSRTRRAPASARDLAAAASRARPAPRRRSTRYRRLRARATFARSWASRRPRRRASCRRVHRRAEGRRATAAGRRAGLPRDRRVTRMGDDGRAGDGPLAERPARSRRPRPGGGAEGPPPASSPRARRPRTGERRRSRRSPACRRAPRSGSLERLELAAGLAGAGAWSQQWPSPGKVVERGTRVRMRLAPAG